MALALEHLLAPPLGLAEGPERRLLAYLRDEDWASALVLLRDAVEAGATRPKLLVVLAYVRFRDAAEVMVDELPEACREALLLLDQALALGVPQAAVIPLREAVEQALDEVSREELRLGALAAEGGPGALSLEGLEALAFFTWKADPARAATYFEALAGSTSGREALVARARAALCLVEAGRPDDAQAGLELTAAADWSAPGLEAEGAVLEAVSTALVLRAAPADFAVSFSAAEARGRRVGLPFPSVWPHQERLLARCLELGDLARARALATLVEERQELSAATRQLVWRALRPTS